MKNLENSKALIFPGDHLSFIEEFEGGPNTYISNGSVRSSSLGIKTYDLKQRRVDILGKKKAVFPKIGDIIVGYVEMLFGSMLSIKVLYINNKKYNSGLSVIASGKYSDIYGNNHRRDRYRERRIRFIYRVGDIIRGRVYSFLNSSAHVAINENNFGVIYSTCYSCGGDTIKLNNSTKCIECGITEDKKLSDDFGIQSLISLRKKT